MFAFYTACASFIGQNWGAGNKKRMLKTYGSALHMPSSQARSLVDCFLFSVRSFCHCLPQNQPSLMPAWKGSESWASAMPSAVLWIAASPLLVASEKVSHRPSSLFWDPVYSVSSGSIRCSHTSRPFPRFISCIFSHGELQALRRFCSLL